MKQNKSAFFLSLGLSMGLATLAAPSFAADSSTIKTAVAKSIANTATPGTEEHCDMHKPGMMGDHMSGKIGDHKAGMMDDHMGGKMDDSESAMMGDRMDGKMCDHETAGKMCGHEGGGMMGGHMGGLMGGYGSGMMMGSPHINLIKSLDLSSEQRSKINKLSDTLRHNNWASMGLIMDESAKLRDLYDADKRNPSAIGKVYQKIFDSQRQMIEAMIDTQNRIEELLTPGQRTQLKNLRYKMGSTGGCATH